MDYLDCTQAIEFENIEETFRPLRLQSAFKKPYEQVAILISSQKDNKKPFPLYEGENVVGRGLSCGVKIDNKVMSKRHAIIEIEKGQYFLQDQNSLNGTFKGKVRLKPNVMYNIEIGETLIFGNLEFKLQRNLQPPPLEDSPCISPTQPCHDLSIDDEDVQGEPSSTADRSDIKDSAAKSETNLNEKSSPNKTKEAVSSEDETDCDEDLIRPKAKADDSEDEETASESEIENRKVTPPKSENNKSASLEMNNVQSETQNIVDEELEDLMSDEESLLLSVSKADDVREKCGTCEKEVSGEHLRLENSETIEKHKKSDTTLFAPTQPFLSGSEKTKKDGSPGSARESLLYMPTQPFLGKDAGKNSKDNLEDTDSEKDDFMLMPTQPFLNSNNNNNSDGGVSSKGKLTASGRKSFFKSRSSLKLQSPLKSQPNSSSDCADPNAFTQPCLALDGFNDSEDFDCETHLQSKPQNSRPIDMAKDNLFSAETQPQFNKSSASKLNSDSDSETDANLLAETQPVLKKRTALRSKNKRLVIESSTESDVDASLLAETQPFTRKGVTLKQTVRHDSDLDSESENDACLLAETQPVFAKKSRIARSKEDKVFSAETQAVVPKKIVKSIMLGASTSKTNKDDNAFMFAETQPMGKDHGASLSKKNKDDAFLFAETQPLGKPEESDETDTETNNWMNAETQPQSLDDSGKFLKPKPRMSDQLTSLNTSTPKGTLQFEDSFIGNTSRGSDILCMDSQPNSRDLTPKTDSMSRSRSFNRSSVVETPSDASTSCTPKRMVSFEGRTTLEYSDEDEPTEKCFLTTNISNDLALQLSNCDDMDSLGSTLKNTDSCAETPGSTLKNTDPCTETQTSVLGESIENNSNHITPLNNSETVDATASTFKNTDSSNSELQTACSTTLSEIKSAVEQDVAATKVKPSLSRNKLSRNKRDAVSFEPSAEVEKAGTSSVKDDDDSVKQIPEESETKKSAPNDEATCSKTDTNEDSLETSIVSETSAPKVSVAGSSKNTKNKNKNKNEESELESKVKETSSTKTKSNSKVSTSSKRGNSQAVQNIENVDSGTEMRSSSRLRRLPAKFRDDNFELEPTLEEPLKKSSMSPITTTESDDSQYGKRKLNERKRKVKKDDATSSKFKNVDEPHNSREVSPSGSVNLDNSDKLKSKRKRKAVFADSDSDTLMNQRTCKIVPKRLRKKAVAIVSSDSEDSTDVDSADDDNKGLAAKNKKLRLKEKEVAQKVESSKEDTKNKDEKSEQTTALSCKSIPSKVRSLNDDSESKTEGGAANTNLKKSSLKTQTTSLSKKSEVAEKNNTTDDASAEEIIPEESSSRLATLSTQSKDSNASSVPETKKQTGKKAPDIDLPVRKGRLSKKPLKVKENNTASTSSDAKEVLPESTSKDVDTKSAANDKVSTSETKKQTGKRGPVTIEPTSSDLPVKKTRVSKNSKKVEDDDTVSAVSESKEIVPESDQNLLKKVVARGSAKGAKQKKSSIPVADEIEDDEPSTSTALSTKNKVSNQANTETDSKKEPVEESKTKTRNASVEDSTCSEKAPTPAKRGRPKKQLETVLETKECSNGSIEEFQSVQKGSSKTVHVTPKKGMPKRKAASEASVSLPKPTTELESLASMPRRGRGKKQLNSSEIVETLGETMLKQNPPDASKNPVRRGRQKNTQNSESSPTKETFTVPKAASRRRRTSVESIETPKKDRRERDSSVESSGSSVSSVTSSTGKRRQTTKKASAAVVFTGIQDTEAEEVITNLGGTIVTDVNSCTHLCTDKFRRTVKFLCCVGKGVPIVGPKWINSCKKEKRFVDSQDHILHDKDAEKTYSFKLGETLKKASESLLFSGWSIHVTPGVVPGPEQMKEIIECAGGTYLAKLPRNPSEKTVVVSNGTDKKITAHAAKMGLPVVTNEFILTGLIRYKVDLEEFSL